MKVVYGFEMPIGIYDLIPHEQKMKIFDNYLIDYFQFIDGEIKIVIGQVYQDIDYIRLDTDYTKKMEEFLDKDRISELELMKKVEKILKYWIEATEKYLETEYGKNYKFPENLKFDWYIFK